ncbi:MAG TPA: hypothetical protein VJV79_21595 [Polyangiaceae bacterium]|nr:hypothetical protein [Polyangiaceae bacterium]
MFERSSLAVIGLLGLLVVGCSKETTSSNNIKTPGIAALIDVYADTATTATVHVELRVGGSDSNAYVNLEGGDELTATAGTESKVLTARDAGVYEANFSGVTAETLFTVVLDRPKDTTAANNSGSLPEPFELNQPAAGLSRANDDLEVTWEPSGTGDDMDFDFDGPCIFDYSKSPSDVGSFTVGKGTLDSLGGDDPETCDIKLDARRSRAGAVDKEFDPESWFRLHQRRSTKFSSKP